MSKYFEIRRNVDAQFLDHAFRDGAVRRGALDGECSAETQAERVVHAELVALGVSAKVVVIVEDQDAGFAAGGLAIEVRRGKTADAAADDDQIVGFAGVFGLARGIPERAVAQGCERRRTNRDGCRACR